MLGSSKNEERIDEGVAEARGEVDSLDFAAAERAGGAVQREVAEADFEKIGEAEKDALTQLLGVIVLGREDEGFEESRGPA